MTDSSIQSQEQRTSLRGQSIFGRNTTTGRCRHCVGSISTSSQGEFVAIVGQSGSGKSTLLQLLGALDHPERGHALFAGNLPCKSELISRHIRAREVGFIFQAFHLLPTFTAIENVQMPMFETDRSAPDRKKRAVELLERGRTRRAACTISHPNCPAASVSAWPSRAVSRMVASVLLADEPTGNLDSENAALILDLIVRLRREQAITLILVTHDMGIARKAGRIVTMKDGRIVPQPQGQATQAI